MTKGTKTSGTSTLLFQDQVPISTSRSPRKEGARRDHDISQRQLNLQQLRADLAELQQRQSMDCAQLRMSCDTKLREAATSCEELKEESRF